MNTFDQIAGVIIKDQAQVLGLFAWDEAALVKDLRIVDRETGNVQIAENADRSKVIDELVNHYVELFGRAARESCREAAATLLTQIPADEVPLSLKK